MRNMTISDHMIQRPYSVGPDHPIADAMELMRDCIIRHLPVVEDERLVGLVSERDLKAALSNERAKSLTVADIMKRDVYVVSRNTPISEVCNTMADNKMGSVVVVNADRQAIGIFTTTDALRLLAETIESGDIEDYLSDDYQEPDMENPDWRTM